LKKALLIILDGFGFSNKTAGNAVAAAHMPFFRKLQNEHPHTFLKTWGHAAGLPESQTGASEPGHVTIGAGRIVWQPLEKINRAFASGDILANANFQKFLHSSRTAPRIHLIGLVSPGGVHSHLDHLGSILRILENEKIPSEKIFLHAIADGRDVSPRSTSNIFEQFSKEFPTLNWASLAGRFFAMDRDQNWDRTEKYFQLLTAGQGEKIVGNFRDQNFWSHFSRQIYRQAENDYFLPPFTFDRFQPIAENDAVLVFNFRSDRSAQITQAFCDREFSQFERPFFFKKNFFIFGPFSRQATCLFPPEKITNSLGETLAKNGRKQLRIAETEKFAHVTFFFNGQEKEPFANETRILVDSPKCKSFAQKPAMGALEVCQQVCQQIENGDFQAIILNFANADLVGHSGDLQAAKLACETLDACLEKIVPLARAKDFQIIVTADHGNAEEMLDAHGQMRTSHSKNPVPCIFICDRKIVDLRSRSSLGEKCGVHMRGQLADLAPTLLDFLEIEKPEEMTGESFAA